MRSCPVYLTNRVSFMNEPQVWGAEDDPRVPVEVTRSIIEYVSDRHTLTSLSRASRIFNYEAERLLYREPFPCSRSETVALLNVMGTNPRIAAHVHTLIVDMTEDRHIEFFDSDMRPPTRSVEHERNLQCFERCMRSLAKALDNMLQLRVLKIYPDAAYDPLASAWPLRHCTSRLLELRCGFTWDQELVRFLSTQPEIVDLCLEHNLDFSSHTILESLLPNLSKFEGMPTTAAKLCPGRPVSHISVWLNDTSNLSSLACQFARSIKPIVSLELGDYNLVSLSDMVLARLHVHMPQLLFLGPCIIPPWDEDTYLSDIARFKDLHTFVLLDYESQHDLTDAPGASVQGTLVENLQAACPSLRRVAFAYSMGEPSNWLWVFESGAWVRRRNMPIRFLWKEV